MRVLGTLQRKDRQSQLAGHQAPNSTAAPRDMIEMIIKLFHALCEVGLDRKQLSIHEMLMDILEVVEVAHGLKPAHLAGHGERSPWRMDEFERIAAEAGLQAMRTSEILRPEDRYEHVADEFPLIAAAMRARTVQTPRPLHAQQVLWIFRERSLETAISRLVAGEQALLPAVLGYPRCCADYDLRSEINFVRALLRLYEAQHGIRGEAAALQAMEAGVTVSADQAASIDLEPVWRTRIRFPFIGHTACPQCLSKAQDSPSGEINRRAREFAFSLDAGYARALWQAALAEAALATTGDFRSLDPAPADPCPCGSDLPYRDCCAGRAAVRLEFR